jgi:hypothetical protein
MAVNLRFLNRGRYFFIEVASQLSSRVRVDPVTDPLLLANLVSPGIDPGTSGPVVRNSDH